MVQWLFVRHQLYSVSWAEADDSAARIAGEIAGTNGLDMAAIKNAFFPVREWYIVAASGTVLDLEGSTPNLVGRVTLPNASDRPARFLCICAPASQEEFFKEVGTPVGTRATPAPKLAGDQQTAFVAKVSQLAPNYRTELLK